MISSKLTSLASAKISSDLVNLYVSVSTADIFNAVLVVEKEGAKAAAELTISAVANANFMVMDMKKDTLGAKMKKYEFVDRTEDEACRCEKSFFGGLTHQQRDLFQVED
jgi:hypothetical protein